MGAPPSINVPQPLAKGKSPFNFFSRPAGPRGKKERISLIGLENSCPSGRRPAAGAKIFILAFLEHFYASLGAGGCRGRRSSLPAVDRRQPQLRGLHIGGAAVQFCHRPFFTKNFQKFYDEKCHFFIFKKIMGLGCSWMFNWHGV